MFGDRAGILRTGLLFLFLPDVHSKTECQNELRDELYMCDNGCCGNSPNRYCCAPSARIAYLIVAAVLLSILMVVFIVLWYKKKTVARRRTRPSEIVIRMTGERSSNLPRACIDGSDRANFNYYHLQWIYGQPLAPPPYYPNSASVCSTHASNNINRHTSGQTTEWQEYRNAFYRTMVQTSPPPPYSENNESNA